MEKLAVLELHFDGVQIGPKTLSNGETPASAVEDSEAASAVTDVEAETTAGGSGVARRALGALGVVALLSAVATVATRRYRGAEREDPTIDGASDAVASGDEADESIDIVQ